jgi:polyphosphate kinase 2 (PPK2 family)
VIVIFEGRDAAGKGGTIRALTERVSPRVFRLVALPAPSDREKSQMYLQRYMQHFPGRGRDRDLRPELVQPRRRRVRHGLSARRNSTPLPRTVPDDREVHRGRRHQLIKIWLEVERQGAEAPFEARIDDPLRQWKLSPMDLPRAASGSSIRARAT